MITLLICSVTMSALALFYMVTPLLTKRYYAWLFIVIWLIIPFRPQFSNSVVKVDILSNTVIPNVQIGNGTPILAPIENLSPSASPNISLWQIVALIWLMGMIIFLAYHIIKHYHFLKLVARWSKKIGLQFCDSIGNPMMIGFAHPCILLPKADFAKDELCFILKHELVHYQRKDL